MMVELLERLIDRPSGGRLHQIVIGVLAAVAFLATGLWLLGHAGTAFTFTLPSRSGRATFVDTSGLIAGLAGGALISLGTHLHAGWFWGLRNEQNGLAEIARLAMLLAAFVALVGTVARLAFLTLR